jgi:hypothetical protein
VTDDKVQIPTVFEPGLKFKLPLWSRRPKSWLLEQYEQDRVSFNKGFRQRVPRSEDKVFNLTRFLLFHNKVSDFVLPTDPRFGGYDPAGEKRLGNALVTAAITNSGMRVITECRLWRGSFQETASQLTNAYLRHRYSLLVVENVALQGSILQLMEYACPELPTVGFQTGQNKAHPEHGLQGLAAEMNHGIWALCMGDAYDTYAPLREHAPACGCAYHSLITDLMEYPSEKRQEDLMMAMWFCREGLRGAPMAGYVQGLEVPDGIIPAGEIGGSFLDSY